MFAEPEVIAAEVMSVARAEASVAQSTETSISERKAYSGPPRLTLSTAKGASFDCREQVRHRNTLRQRGSLCTHMLQHDSGGKTAGRRMKYDPMISVLRQE